ncbi:MAG: SIMPL domain-containing protein [Candidatus Andersenbacteria bacterium]|nr:SIMPL domain-containing protein [Candidatus Andersenbacteria bacterium]
MMTPRLAFALVAAGGTFYLVGQYLASQPLREQQAETAERQIAVTGRGEVTAEPDIARLTLGVRTGRQPTAEAALTALTQSFDKVVAALKEAGVAEDDITTTDLATQPLYDYREGRQTILGYEANETVRVTVRDLPQAGKIAAQATAAGANQLSGIQFEIDDPQKLQLEAQKKAVADAQDQAQQLATSLGVKLGKVTSFSSAPEFGPPTPVFSRAEALDVGGAAPPVPAGTQDVVMIVNVSYEIK